MSHVGFTAHEVWIRLQWAVVSVEIFLNQNVFCGEIVIESKENIIFSRKWKSVCVCHNFKRSISFEFL